MKMRKQMRLLVTGLGSAANALFPLVAITFSNYSVAVAIKY